MLNIKPIFVDRSVRPQDYDGMMDHTLFVKSIFFTMQGEGPFAGKRAIFLRLAGCNLGGKGVTGPGCPFCDTDFRFDSGAAMTFATITERIRKLYKGEDKRKLVVITGGEPMLQRNLSSFIRGCSMDCLFQIESNGTRILKDLPRTGVSLVVSPKIPQTSPDDTVSKYTALPPRVLERADVLKFLVSADPESPYHHVPIYAKAFQMTGRPVYVSPMAIYKEEPKGMVSAWNSDTFDHFQTADNHRYACDLVKEHGYIMSMQMHLFCRTE